jgi:hypothetical protein
MDRPSNCSTWGVRVPSGWLARRSALAFASEGDGMVNQESSCALIRALFLTRVVFDAMAEVNDGKQCSHQIRLLVVKSLDVARQKKQTEAVLRVV